MGVQMWSATTIPAHSTSQLSVMAPPCCESRPADLRSLIESVQDSTTGFPGTLAPILPDGTALHTTFLKMLRAAHRRFMRPPHAQGILDCAPACNLQRLRDVERAVRALVE